MTNPIYLYLEAVNLRHVIDDTAQLSVRRAGGYLLLELVHRIAEATSEQLSPISLGASAGLFELKAGQSIARAKECVLKVLEQPLYALATVLVVSSDELQPEPASFSEARERLLARVRRRQLSTLSMATGWPSEPSATACALDQVRPATTRINLGEKPEHISQASQLRYEQGRSALRQGFYRRELNTAGIAHSYDQDGLFTDDLDELSRFGATWRDAAPRSQLQGKIAILYADGNGFGSHAAKCGSATQLTQWDKRLQGARRAFLAKLLEWINQHPFGLADATASKTTVPAPRIRLETLMWGGDEFMFVLPAWLGLDAAKKVFAECLVRDDDGSLLTHSLGLVFAHHNAPIAPLQALAKQLAEQGKDEAFKHQNSLHWMVLESFDGAGEKLDRYWQHRGIASVNWADMRLSPGQLDTLLAFAPTVLKHVPRTSVFQALHLLRSQCNGPDLSADHQGLLLRQYSNVQQAIGHSGTAHAAWTELWKQLRTEPWPEPLTDTKEAQTHLSAWLTLVELWDYLPASPATQSEEVQ
jgi:hypothetical protein